MFTDIQGYTALMQKDESRALLIRKRHREVFKRLHSDFKGEILQYYGDGTLSVFNSSVEAVRCAIALQREMALEPKVPLRVGIHLGDIITTKEEIIGDAVNLASRIESLGIPGSVLISSQVQLQIRNHGIHSKSLGQVSLKNVSQPIEVFAISEEGLTVPAQIRIKGNRIPRRSSRSLTFRQWKIYTGATIGLLVLVYLFVITPLTINKTKRTGNTKDTPVMIENDEIDKSIAVLPFYDG
jgi:hypothetical protein